ncbi:SH3 domain-containing protein [Magnetovibrio sp.]|uniref:SH3 domain-containing protein n=1 Tax=Magnetovibrio sp. TaxID=2024836 RepID=UPI002F95384C
MLMKRAQSISLLLASMLAFGAPAWGPAHAQIEEPGEAPRDFKIEEPTLNEEVEPVVVMEHEVVPMVGLYEVTKDVNVRSGPGTDFERLAGLEAGERVRAIGKVDGSTWMAVSKDGETLGFVFTPVLVPVVDGALGEQFFGSYMSQDQKHGVACDYRFRFEGKTTVEGGDFETADYEVRFRCASTAGAKIFYAHMFLTEAPVKSEDGLHLIGLDVRSIGDGMEEFLTTRYLYHPKTGAMTFEGHSLPRFAKPPKIQSFQTDNIKDALTQALEASVASWTDEAWAELLKKPK